MSCEWDLFPFLCSLQTRCFPSITDRQFILAFGSSNSFSEYPDTPARVQLSIWPAGIESSAQGMLVNTTLLCAATTARLLLIFVFSHHSVAGTIDWAGGMIDWTSSEYTANSHYSVVVSSLAMTCWDDTPLGNSSIQSYVYSKSVEDEIASQC